jgi:hypothetical protein
MAKDKTKPAIRKERGLRKLSALLTELRSLDALSETSPGVFRWKSRAFLHFHYFPDGTLVADVLVQAGDWAKFDVTTRTGQQQLIDAVHRAIAE